MKREDILDIMGGDPFKLKDEYDPLTFSEPVEKVGPNNWAQVGPEDFATTWDYETYEIGNMTVIYAVSDAALQWCYRFLPQGLDRWRARGFKVETRWLHLIEQSMDADGLMSEKTYNDSMEELNAIARQWE